MNLWQIMYFNEKSIVADKNCNQLSTSAGYNWVLSAAIDIFAILKSIVEKSWDTSPQFTFSLKFTFGCNLLVHDLVLNSIHGTMNFYYVDCDGSIFKSNEIL